MSRDDEWDPRDPNWDDWNEFVTDDEADGGENGEWPESGHTMGADTTSED